MQRAISFLLKHKVLLLIYILVTVIAGLHLYSLGQSHLLSGKLYGQYMEGSYYTHYNNYIIFKNSFFHLISGKDMYILYPAEQWDLYKYSPSFALAMGALAYLPDIAGLTLWNLLNALALFAAIRLLPLPYKSISFILLFILLELLTALQSCQSNALLAGLLIGAFALMERKKTIWATLLLVVATFIKVYGAVGFAIFLFYPDKIRFILFAAMWTILVAAMPLLAVSPQELAMQYESWVRMMSMDQSFSYGFSVMGWLNTWFGLTEGKTIVMGIGILLFFVPLLRYNLYKEPLYRLLFLAFMLVWVIIFNYKAESSTFIIAIAGVAIWYFAKARKKWETAVLVLVFVFSCLSPTDLFPPGVRKEILVPYVVKVVPCILTWVIILVEMLRYKSVTPSTPTVHIN